jgi:hypothetical protein
MSIIGHMGCLWEGEMVEVKLTARAQGMLCAYAPASVANAACEGLRRLAAFAAQNPRIEPMNYGYGREGWRAYRREAAQVSRDLAEVRRLIGTAVNVGVTDDELIEACRGDRLTIERDGVGGLRVDYCTGQYWPTEYRRAVARVVRRAIDEAAARHYPREAL